MKGYLAEADTGERMLCQSKHTKGHVMKDSSLKTCMYWFNLHCVVEFHCDNSIGRNSPKTFWLCAVVSRYFLGLRLIGRLMLDEIGTHAKARHMLRQDSQRTCEVWRDINKTYMMGSGRG